MKKESTSLSEVLSRIYQIIWGRFPQLCSTCKVTSTRTGQLLNGSDITSNYHGHGGQHSSFVCAKQLHCSVNPRLHRSAERPEEAVACSRICFLRYSIWVHSSLKVRISNLTNFFLQVRMLFY